jgi:hypothetical protein
MDRLPRGSHPALTFRDHHSSVHPSCDPVTVLRFQSYSDAIGRRKGLRLLALGLCAALAGCSMGGGKDVPIATGSITPAVEVEGPLPQTLAYSDAAMMGQAASAAETQQAAPSGFEWVNASTGSSGTLQGLPTPAADPDPSRACKAFNAMVTSFGGVHSYNGRVCSRSDGQRTISIDAPA